MATGLACSEVLSDLAEAGTTRCSTLRVGCVHILLSLGKINSKANSYKTCTGQGSYVEVEIGGLVFGARYVVHPPHYRDGWDLARLGDSSPTFCNYYSIKIFSAQEILKRSNFPHLDKKMPLGRKLKLRRQRSLRRGLRQSAGVVGSKIFRMYWRNLCSA